LKTQYGFCSSGEIFFDNTIWVLFRDYSKSCSWLISVLLLQLYLRQATCDDGVDVDANCIRMPLLVYPSIWGELDHDEIKLPPRHTSFSVVNLHT
jgi:hypothetical protein